MQAKFKVKRFRSIFDEMKLEIFNAFPSYPAIANQKQSFSFIKFKSIVYIRKLWWNNIRTGRFLDKIFSETLVWMSTMIIIFISIHYSHNSNIVVNMR